MRSNSSVLLGNGVLSGAPETIDRPCVRAVLGESSLRRTLAAYFDYYHRSRTPLSLAKDSPEPHPIQQPEIGPVVAVRQVGGLHHRYERRAA